MMLNSMITTTMNTRISIVVAGIIPLLVKLIGVTKAQKINHNLATKQGFAENVVLAIQQQFEALDTKGKYVNSLKTLSSILEAHKIPFTTEELNVLIESSIKTLKNDFKDQWSKVTTQAIDSQNISIEKQGEVKMTRNEFYEKYMGQIDAVGIATATDKFIHNIEHFGEAGFDVYSGMGAITAEQRAGILRDIAVVANYLSPIIFVINNFI